MLKAIGEEHKGTLKRSTDEEDAFNVELPTAKVSKLFNGLRTLTPTAAKHSKSRIQVERILERVRRLVGGEIPPLAYFPLLEFSQCVDISRTYNCSMAYRSTDGSCNNVNMPLRGAANTAFRRLLSAEYEDGIYVPIGTNQTVNGDPFAGPWPSPRTITRNIVRGITINSQVFSMMFTLYGQFLALDFTRFGEFGTQVCAQSCNITENLPFCVPILVEEDDPSYGINSTNNASCLFIRRAVGECMQPFNSTFNQSRQQINQITHYLDASGIYGNNDQEAAALRAFRGGELRQSDRLGTTKGNLPISPAPSATGVPFFAAGDIRVDNYVHQTVIMTLWYRMHNYIVGELAEINPCWDDERLYQEGRKIVGAILQVITYREYLPLLFGDQYDTYIGDYTGYNPSVDATVPHSFATAAMRFGHSMFHSETDRFDSDGKCLPIGPLNLRDAFFNPLQYYVSGGTDPLLRGLLRSNSRELDEFVSIILTTQLFPLPGASLGLDLSSQNIQRAREHGVPPYRTWQRYCTENYGITANFSNKNTDMDLRRVYGDYGYENGMDLWVGGLAEKKLAGSTLGPTFACIIGQTFSNLRTGDRFYWENPDMFTGAQRQTLSQITIAKVICENADNITNISPRAFEYGIDEVSCNSLPSLDLTNWRDPDAATCNTDIVINSGSTQSCGCNILYLCIAFIFYITLQA